MSTPAPSSSSSPPPLTLKRVCTVVPVLRFVRITTIKDIVKLAHINDTFRDALESYSVTVWRRIASRLDKSALRPFFTRDAFAWVAENMLTGGQLDVSRMEQHPLLVAAGNGAVDVVRVCVAVIPSCVNECGSTALRAAISCGQTDCVRELVAAGVDITTSSKGGSTALHYAAEYGDADALRLLIAHADFVTIRDKRDRYGYTALHHASSIGHDECVRELVDGNVDITVVDDDNGTALHYAAEYGTSGIVRLLAAHRDYKKIRDLRNNHGKTAMDAAKSNEVKQLLSSNNK